MLTRFLSFILMLSMFACVPARKVEEMQSKMDKCEAERSKLAQSAQDLETRLKEADAELLMLREDVQKLKEDTTMLGRSFKRLTRQYDKLNEINDQLLSKQRRSMESSESENRKLMRELMAAQEELQVKEDMLRQLERDLDAKKKNLDQLELELQDREKKLRELQRLIDEKDKAVRELKDRITEALLGFKDKGLTVETRNGRIQVSMEAKLLFPSGSTSINPDGKQALIDLAKVLEEQENLTVLVEGHTDTDAFRGRGEISDNWDLSVMRATAVVKIMLANSKLDPKMLTAAGRSEFVPIDPGSSPEAKAKNRRIEIILTPNLDQLFEILGN